MIKLNVPIDVSIELYYKIINNKHGARKSRLTDLKNVITERYVEYREKTEELALVLELNIFNDDQKEDLWSCYGNNKEFSIAGKSIKELQSASMQAICPYCGIGEPNTIDHYLPKEKFPEFSVLEINLVPCCATCNNEKGSVWLTDGVRSFLNFYFDNIPTTKFLYTYINFAEGSDTPTVGFELRETSEIGTRVFNIMKIHFRRLNLLTRYEKKVNDEISGVFYEVYNAAEVLTIEEQKQNLQRRIQALKFRCGENYWKASLLEAVLESEQFFNKCYNIDV